jgi:hypothetical protein
MKKSLAILFCLIASTTQAQITYGIKGGLNLSDVVLNDYINPDAESDFTMKLGPHAGLYFTTPASEKFSFAAELLYSDKGVKAVNPVHLHYINVPLLAQYRLTDELKVEVGPELGYMVAARSKYGNVSGIWSNKLDFGFDAGLLLNLNENFGVTLRYYAGFSSVIEPYQQRDSNNNPTSDKIKYQNRVLQLSLNYKLGER